MGAHGRAVAALVGAAFAFGTTFAVVQEAVDDVEPVPFLAVRFLIAGLVLAPFAARRAARSPAPDLTRAGALAGVALTVSYVLQTVGLQYTTTSASAFLTYLLVVIVPFLQAAVLRRPPTGSALVAVVVAVAGVRLLTGAEGVGLGRGELLTIGCAAGFAVHVILVARFAPRFDLVRLNAVQLATVGLLCLPVGALAGGYAFTAAALAAAAYTGLVASALAFAGQLYGQRHLDPTRASLILLLEPVFAAALGAARGETLGAAGAAGGLLILAALVIAEVGPALRAARATWPERRPVP